VQSTPSKASRDVHVYVETVHVSLSASTIASNFVTLSWNGSSSLIEATTYLLEYRNRDMIVHHELEISPNLKTHTFTVKDLDPGRLYEFHLNVGSREASIRLASTKVNTDYRCIAKL
jgi:hypothetical protein